MNNAYFMGYKIHRNIKHFTPMTVLFSKGTENITVAMAKDALDYIIKIASLKTPAITSYTTAISVFRTLKGVLDNKQAPRQRKEDLKIAIDVLEEIVNQTAKSEEEKIHNTRCALICKLMIDGFSGGMS